MKFTITKNSNYEIETKSGKFSINGNSATNGIKQLADGDVIEVSDNDLRSVAEVPTNMLTPVYVIFSIDEEKIRVTFSSLTEAETFCKQLYTQPFTIIKDLELRTIGSTEYQTPLKGQFIVVAPHQIKNSIIKS